MESAFPILVLALLVFIFDGSDAAYVMANGGFCQTYASTSAGTPITFEPCDYEKPRHSSWKNITITGKTAHLLCIGDTNICLKADADGKHVLAKKDEAELAQQWKDAGKKRISNELYGPNFCSQAMYANVNDKIPTFSQMKPCNDNYDQQFVTYASFASLAKYFRDAFYQDSEAAFNNKPLFPQHNYLPIYPYRYYSQPITPYYYL